MLKIKQLPLLASILLASAFATWSYADDPASDSDVISDADAIVTGNKGAPLFSKRTAVAGPVKLLRGTSAKKYAGDAEAVAKSFLKEKHATLGIPADLADLQVKHIDTTPERNHVRLQQMVRGIPVEGGEILVHTTIDGQVTMVQNNYVAQPEPTNQDILTEAVAIRVARDDLALTTSANSMSVSRAEKRIGVVQGARRLLWVVTTSTKSPMGYWVYRIDAETGAILYKGNEITSLRSGKGKVYKNNKAYKAHIVSTVSLPNMLTAADGYATPGFLTGLHADIYDFNGNDPFSSRYSFMYNQSSQKDQFDATNAYYQMNAIWKWWNTQVVTKYSLSTPANFYTYSIPAVVSVDALCNAFYTPDLNGDGSNFPGFVFGDENSCFAGSEDLVIDNDVFRHEFAHAMMDWSGAGFQAQYGGAVDHYGRAMGEGNSDWYAFLYSKDPIIGEVAFPGGLRTLDNTNRYPADVDDPFNSLPEEHYTGQIWEGYLYDVYRALKTTSGSSKAIPYIFQASYYFSTADGFVDGEPDFQDAVQAAAAAEDDLTGKLTSTAKVWGAMASRGINAALRAPYSHASDYLGSGIAGSDTNDYFMFDFPAVTSITTRGNMLVTGDVHEYVINATVSGLTLTVTVTGQSTGLISPTAALYTIGGSALASAGPVTATKTVLTYPNLPAGAYVIEVTGSASAPARGYYTVKVATN